MSSLPIDISFEEWRDHVFKHEVSDPAWYFETDNPYWDYSSDPGRCLSYLTRLFRQSSELLDLYSVAQVGQGLYYLVSNSCSDYAFVMKDLALPRKSRVACITAISSLYSECFAKACAHYYCHLDHGPEERNPLNGICYMLWDVIPLCAAVHVNETVSRPGFEEELRALLEGMEDAPGVSEARSFLDDGVLLPPTKKLSAEEREDSLILEDACLRVMESTLELDHPACQEGALHGLGHWHSGYEERVESIIDQFLARKKLSKEIRSYAKNARTGYIN